MHRKYSTSLKTALILPYVFLITASALALSGASYWASSRSITMFSQHLMSEVVARISQAVHFHLHGSGAVLDAAFPEGIPVAADLSTQQAELRTRFWIATSMYTNPNDYVYYGNAQGQFFGLKRRGDQEAELRIKLQAAAHREFYRAIGIHGTPQLLLQEQKLYDPRSRVWYQLASRTQNHTWTAVYVDFSSGNLIVTRSRQVLDANGVLAGVVATDVMLQALNRFVAALDVGEHGRAFIVERDGQVIAASSVPNVLTSADGGAVRINANAVDDPTIRAAYQSIAPIFNSATSAETVHQVTATDARGREIAVAARRIVDSAGLDWIAVVAVPRSAVLAGVNQQIWIGLAIGLIAVLLAVAVGMRIFWGIAHDITSLSNAVNRVRRGVLDVPIQVQRQDEVGDLARNFKAMHTELFTDRLTGVANRTALTSLLNGITAAPNSRPFTLFFIDLNHFKPLNDQHGHANGDLALTEVAQRFQASLRPDDFVARLGGDEFVVIAMDVSAAETIAALVLKLTAIVERPLQSLHNIPADTEVCLGAAIGYARWPEDAGNAEKLLKLADADMYKGKEARRR